MRTYTVKVTAGLEFEDEISLPVETTGEVENRLKTYVEQVLFEAIPGNNIALDVRVVATQVGRAAPQDGL